MTVKPTYEELEKKVRQLEKIKSERKQVEEVLKESESKYRALYENSLEAILLTAQDGSIYAANQVACEILEKSESEIISGGRDRMVNLDDPRLSAALEERYKNGKFNGELTFKKKDGTIFPVELSSSTFQDRLGNEKACIFFRDISERKRAEEALKDSENMFRTIFNLSQQAIGLTEINTGKLVKVNPKLCDLSQYSKKELVGKTTTELGFYTEKDRKKFIDELKKSGCVDGLEMEFRAKDGSKITALMFANIIKISDLDYILTIFFDLTRLKILEEELIARNKDLLLAQRIAGVGNWSLDPEIGVPVWSEEVYSIYERDMELGPYLLDDCPTIYRDKWWETFRDAIQGAMYEGRPYDIELKLELPSKKEKWIHAVCQPHSERGPKGYYLQGTIQDITERKQAEEALHRERERLASIIEGTNVGTWEWNVQTGETIFNERWAEIIGYSLKEISPVSIDTWMKFTHPDDLKNSGELIQRHFSGELDYYECEARMRHKNGEWIWVLDRGKVAVWTEDGKPLRIMGTHQDITERKRSENRLKKNEELYRTLFSDSHTPIFMVDEKSRSYIDANQAALDFMECNREQLIGKSVYDSTPPEKIKQAKKEHANFSEIKSLETDYLVNDKIKTLLLEVTPLELDGDRILIGIGQDITERKRAEAEREKLEVQLNQAQKMESVGRLAGGVAHDFNNMLGVILGHTELALLQADEKQELYSDLKEIQKAAKRSADTTKQLLAFARKDIISPKKLDLNNTVESILNMLRRLIGEDIDLVWKPSANLWPIKMDPSQIDQILANLCVNARDAISGVGKLTIETGRKTFDEEYCKEHAGFILGDFVLLAVSDNGCGMDKETLENLFEPFFTTKEVGKGTGLGLATVYGIVKQNNGFINVYSESGQGSTFNIYLPRLVDDEHSDTVVPEKKIAAGGTETILLVEDEPTILRMTRMMLERKGYSVLTAATPGEAIEKATNHSGSIDLLMTDVVMPEMNGRDLSGQITDLYPDIKLLFMSGYTADVIAHQGILNDGVAFIQKPFSMADMTEKVREVLDMAPDKN